MFVNEIEERVIKIAEYVAETEATVRAAAKNFGISKSTAHKDLRFRLKQIDKPLYNKIARILDKNRAERHIRGGQATKLKYLKEQKS